jgi:flavin-dependent dehydrogenase
VTGVRIGTANGPRILPASIVIAADGRGSRLGAALKLSRFSSHPRRWAFGAYYSGVAAMTSRGEMHIQANGYLGIAPLPGGAANVCVVRELPSARSYTRAERNGAGAAERFQAVTIIEGGVAADAVLRERFNGAERCTPVTSLGPLALEADAAGVPGLLLAGDSAGFVDPMTGDGLRFAIAGGVLAADAALRELASGKAAFAQLAAARHRAFAGKWRLNRALRALIGSPRGVALAAALTARWDAPVRYLVAAAGDVRLAGGGAPVPVGAPIPGDAPFGGRLDPPAAAVALRAEPCRKRA